MGKIAFPPSVKLVAGFIFRDPEILAAAEQELQDRYGPLDAAGPVVPFIHTRYYEAEFGPDLLRKFVGFREPVSPDVLPSVKVETNRIELRLADPEGGGIRRRINIDPGYLALEKVVFATTKNRDHRPYLHQGIFAELTYRFFKGTYVPLEWTYPDYREGDTIALFNRWREAHFRARAGAGTG